MRNLLRELRQVTQLREFGSRGADHALGLKALARSDSVCGRRRCSGVGEPASGNVPETITPALLVRHAGRDLVFRDGRALAGSVAGWHCAERFVALLVVVLGVKEDDHE